jgi:hypothetical protein
MEEGNTMVAKGPYHYHAKLNTDSISRVLGKEVVALLDRKIGSTKDRCKLKRP